jgi:hypothetical protein
VDAILQRCGSIFPLVPLVHRTSFLQD